MNSKDEFRQLIKEIKQSLPIEKILRDSSLICRRIEDNMHFKNASVVVSYWPLSKEVNVIDINNKYCKQKTILLPAVINGEIALKPYTKHSEFTTGQLGVKEPIGIGFENTENIDVVLVPGIAFDKNLNRLGRGRGYYDRFLSSTNAYKIGVCFQFQYFDSIPASKDDIKVDELIFF